MMLDAYEPVVRLRAATKADPYSKKPVPDWSVPPSELSLSALVGNAGSSEPLVPDRTPVEADYDLFFDSDSIDIGPNDRILVRGDVCTVQGKPFAWPLAGMVVQAKIREG